MGWGQSRGRRAASTVMSLSASWLSAARRALARSVLTRVMQAWRGLKWLWLEIQPRALAGGLRKRKCCLGLTHSPTGRRIEGCSYTFALRFTRHRKWMAT